MYKYKGSNFDRRQTFCDLFKIWSSIIEQQRMNPWEGWVLWIYRLFGAEVEESKVSWQLGRGYEQHWVDRTHGMLYISAKVSKAERDAWWRVEGGGEKPYSSWWGKTYSERRSGDVLSGWLVTGKGIKTQAGLGMVDEALGGREKQERVDGGWWEFLPI